MSGWVNLIVKGIKKVPMAVKTEKRTKGWLCVGGWGPLQLLRIIPATGGPGDCGVGAPSSLVLGEPQEKGT